MHGHDHLVGGAEERDEGEVGVASGSRARHGLKHLAGRGHGSCLVPLLEGQSLRFVCRSFFFILGALLLRLWVDGSMCVCICVWQERLVGWLAAGGLIMFVTFVAAKKGIHVFSEEGICGAQGVFVFVFRFRRACFIMS